MLLAAAGGCEVLAGIDERTLATAPQAGTAADADAGAGAGGTVLATGGGSTGTGGGAAGSGDAGAAPDACGTGGAVDLAPSYAAAVLADGPAGYWPLDDPGPTAAGFADVSGHARHGSVVGSVAFGVPGALGPTGGTAAELDGGFAYLDVGAGPFEFGAGSFSVEAWVRVAPEALDAHYRLVFAKQDYSPADERTGYELWVRRPWPDAPDADVSFLRFVGADWPVNGSAATKWAATDAWIHLVARYDAAAPPKERSALFVDGEQVATGPGSGDVTCSAPFTWGWSAEGGGEPFVGRLDELALFDYALPCHRIRAHYASAQAAR